MSTWILQSVAHTDEPKLGSKQHAEKKSKDKCPGFTKWKSFINGSVMSTNAARIRL